MAVFVKDGAPRKKGVKRKIAQKKKVGSCVPHDRKDEFAIVGNYKTGRRRTGEATVTQAATWSLSRGVTPQLEKIESVVSCVAEFGRARSLSVANAYQYLCAHAGLDFLDEHYSISRCYSDEMMDESLSKVCRNHGGTVI